jgi:acyl-CoA synthetase (AMP-forming)/AMP-acid ligase II
VLALAKHPLVDKYNLSSVRTIISGAAPLSADLARACAARLGCTVGQGYGMTEASPVTHFSADPEGRPGAVGPAAPNTECMIVDALTQQPLGPNEAGELWVRGPQVMLGYLNNPTATAITVDREGWLHTGDIAQVDDEGHFTIVDRLKELIKYKGFQVAPAELEAVLLSNPQVADCAVIGVRDEEAGEVPKAFVVRRAGVGDELNEDTLMAYVAEQVAPYKKIRYVEFIEQIPKTASGKILRRELSARPQMPA